jgi:TolB-like protein
MRLRRFQRFFKSPTLRIVQFRYSEDIRKIAEALGVSSILEGSVRRAGPRFASQCS